MAISGNLLNAQDEDLESAGVGNWVNGGNATLTNSTVRAHTGTHALLTTSIAAGLTFPNSVGITCVAGEILRVSTWFFATGTTASANPTNLKFFSAGHTYNSTGNNVTIALAASWQNSVTDYTVPATCITCELVPSWTAVAAGELVYWDTLVISRPQLTPRKLTTRQAVRRASLW